MCGDNLGRVYLAGGRRETACAGRSTPGGGGAAGRPTGVCGAPEPPVATAPLGGVGPHPNPLFLKNICRLSVRAFASVKDA